MMINANTILLVIYKFQVYFKNEQKHFLKERLQSRNTLR